MSYQVGFTIRGVLHVLAKVHKVRCSKLNGIPRIRGFPKERMRRGVWSIHPDFAIIPGITESDERTQYVPIKPLTRVSITVHQAVGPVIPDSVVD
jgi:hypothetical protein